MHFQFIVEFDGEPIASFKDLDTANQFAEDIGGRVANDPFEED